MVSKLGLFKTSIASGMLIFKSLENVEGLGSSLVTKAIKVANILVPPEVSFRDMIRRVSIIPDS